jgi:MFS transporter, ACS family, tartrate transporter
MSIDLYADVDPKAVRRKVAWRILPLIFFLYIIAYLDRNNVGFAKLRMKESLHWSEEVFGWGFGIFYAGYIFLEIPGALIVEHWSARKWFARILITWGICSMGLAFVETPLQFYVARFLLGLAEAGFFPGVIVYFTHWFPRADRGRALSIMVMGIPVSLACGARLSGFILDNNWLGVEGWKWVFLIEGFPAVLFGILVPFLLTARPGQAKWLTESEGAWMSQTLQRERREAAAEGAVTLRQALKQPSVWLLALGIMAANTGGYGISLWMPTVMQDFLHEAVSASSVLNYIGLVYLCGFVGVFVSGQSSDRTGDRKWHCIAGQVLTGTFLAISAIPGQPFSWIMVWFCLMGFFATFWPSPFWVLPTMSMSASAAAVSVAFINICANLAGLLGPPLVGWLRENGYDNRTCLWILAGCYVSGGIIIAFLRVKPKPPQTSSTGITVLPARQSMFNGDHS